QRVAVGEIASGDERRRERLEVAGTDAVEVDVAVLLLSSDDDAIVPEVAAHRRRHHLRHAVDAGNRAEAFDDTPIERGDLRGLDAGLAIVEVRDEHAVLPEA